MPIGQSQLHGLQGQLYSQCAITVPNENYVKYIFRICSLYDTFSFVTWNTIWIHGSRIMLHNFKSRRSTICDEDTFLKKILLFYMDIGKHCCPLYFLYVLYMNSWFCLTPSFLASNLTTLKSCCCSV